MSIFQKIAGAGHRRRMVKRAKEIDRVENAIDEIGFVHFLELSQNPYALTDKELELMSGSEMLKDRAFDNRGMFTIHNRTKDIYYMGVTKNIASEIDMQFKYTNWFGKDHSEIPPIIKDIRDRDSFFVLVVTANAGKDAWDRYDEKSEGIVTNKKDKVIFVQPYYPIEGF